MNGEGREGLRGEIKQDKWRARKEERLNHGGEERVVE